MDRRGFILGATATIMLEGSSIAKASGSGPVIVSAGRRVDAPDAATPRFPANNVDRVRTSIEEYLQREKPGAIVASAACGTDLLLFQSSINLASAGKIPTVRRYVLLPASPEEFRKSSVTDRPGDWGEIYDRVLKESTVEVLKMPAGDEGYLQTNIELLQKAKSVARERKAKLRALVIWNMQSRGTDDVTGHFLAQAEARQIPVTQISTV